jgi:hypothetical protein
VKDTAVAPDSNVSFPPTAEIVRSSEMRHSYDVHRLLLAVPVSATLILCGCRSIADWGPASTQHLKEGDVIAVGWLSNQDSGSGEPDPDDLLGHGWFTADLQISRTESGALPSRVIRVRYYGHTFLSEGSKFRFHLRPSRTGDYFICKPPAGSGYRCE